MPLIVRTKRQDGASTFYSLPDVIPNYRLPAPAHSRDIVPHMNDFKFNADGLIPVIVQEATDAAAPRGRVLMMAWMNRESLEKTLATGKMHYWSRSRQKLWFKGESSGHTQDVVRWYADCDKDCLLFEVKQTTGACHTGYESCFFQGYDTKGAPLPVAEQTAFDAGDVYRKS